MMEIGDGRIGAKEGQNKQGKVMEKGRGCCKDRAAETRARAGLGGRRTAWTKSGNRLER